MPDHLRLNQTDIVTIRRSGGSLFFEEDDVHLLAEIVRVFGGPRSKGQIYGLLYSSPGPLKGIVRRGAPIERIFFKRT